eukprot:scaffold9577_cov95-Skeletonema_marinoi.AAC.1
MAIDGLIMNELPSSSFVPKGVMSVGRWARCAVGKGDATVLITSASVWLQNALFVTTHDLVTSRKQSGSQPCIQDEPNELLKITQ